jgi:hypothetical protein
VVKSPVKRTLPKGKLIMYFFTLLNLSINVVIYLMKGIAILILWTEVFYVTSLYGSILYVNDVQ